MIFVSPIEEKVGEIIEEFLIAACIYPAQECHGFVGALGCLLGCIEFIWGIFSRINLVALESVI